MSISKILNSSLEKRELVGGSLSKVFKNGDYVIKYYDGKYPRGYEKLKREIKYLQEIPKDKKDFFPQILDIEEKNNFVAYLMPFYSNFKTISDLIFCKERIKKVWRILKKSLDIAENIFYLSKKYSTKFNYVERAYLGRAKDALEFFKKSKEYNKLVSEKEIFLNGERLTNLPILIQELEKDTKILNFLSPNVLTFFHGNFHTDNILTDGKKIIFVDPRGEKLGSEDYDKAKMFSHFYLEYDLIHLNYFKFKKDKRSFKIEIINKRISKRYSYLQKKFLEYELDKHKKKESFLKKVMLIGAIHALSFSTYHARKEKPDKDRVITYYLGAVKMFNEFLNNKNIKIDDRAFSLK